MSSLFRAEAIQAQTVQEMGSIRLARNPRFQVIAGVALVLGAALLGYATFGQISTKVQVTGMLMPAQGVIQLTTPTAGVIEAVHAPEGSHVQAGQPIYAINTERIAASGEASKRISEALSLRMTSLEAERQIRTDQAQQRRAMLKARLRDLRTEHQTAMREKDLAENRVKMAERNLGRFQKLESSGFVAETQVQQREEELNDLKSRSVSATRALQVLAREQAAAEAELAALDGALAGELAQLDRAIASLRQEQTENDQRKGQVVVASQQGRMLTSVVSVGMHVQAGQVLGTLAPAAGAQQETLEAHLFAPSRAAGFIKPGQVAWLRNASFPYQKYGMARAVVESVAKAPVHAQEISLGLIPALAQVNQANEPLYRIRLKLDAQTHQAYGESKPLKAGMVLEADIVQSRRAIWEWMFEPLLATRARSST